MELRDAVTQQQEELLKSLQESVRIRSVEEHDDSGFPYGEGVQRSLEHALATARRCGFETSDMDHQVGWCEYGSGEEMIAVLGHLDVVPEGDGWSVDPFGGEIRDGKIWGRGTMDDKGPVFAALYAMKALKESGLPLRRRIRLMFGTNEETGSADMKYYLGHGGELPLMGFTPDGEYPVINGEKGIVNVAFRKQYTQSGPVRLMRLSGGSAPNVVPAAASAELRCPREMAEELRRTAPEKVACTLTKEGVRIEAAGVGAHGSTPEQGENAIGRLMQTLRKLPLEGGLKEAVEFLAVKVGMETDGASLGIALYDEVSGGLTLNLGTIEGGEEELNLRINYRYPVTKRLEDCDPVLRRAFEEAGFQLTGQSHKKSLYVPEDSELIQALLKVYTRETGLEARPKSIGGGTYAKAIPNIVAFGPIFPGDEVREHKPDEFIEVEKLMKNAQIIAQALYELAK
ncbi:dipeptidase PepV [Oscillibacter hominis]|uniref:Dipeptidase PepV n=1 Tax=Oscillibacter hominis TaxID=2763056 RepID=A0A7G9B217_9FIRM|nr:dipeptidase PepV [Oscillibacter hominis]QNL43598.1 dipeptidase PepV [Oscillibacter hominis]